MTQQELKQTMWKDAAQNGLVLGAALSAIIALSIITRIDLRFPYLASILQYGIIILLLYSFCRIRGAKYGKAGFSYGQNMNFILAIMLFTGAIVGIMTFIFQQYLAPEYYREVIEQALRQSVEQGIAQDQASIDTALDMMRSPLIMVLSSMIGMIINGGFLGIFTSLLTRVQPQLDEPDAQDDSSQDSSTKTEE